MGNHKSKSDYHQGRRKNQVDQLLGSIKYDRHHVVKVQENKSHAWNAEDSSDVMLVSPDGLTMRRVCREGSSDGIRGKVAYTSGRHTFQFTCSNSNHFSDVMLGVSTSEAPLMFTGCTDVVGATADSWGWHISGSRLVHDGRTVGAFPCQQSYTVPNTLYAVLDMDNGTLR
ncbi:SPRY domain-containing SOCS box protein 4-like [Saccoglossus kowalevskii]